MVGRAVLTTLGCLRILPILARRLDEIYAGIALAEIAVILLSASGLVQGGE